MKQLFRFFRGEFNGSFIYHLVTCMNYVVKAIVDELVYQALNQWKLEEEITAGEIAIRGEDIINIAKISGLFQPLSVGRTSLGSTYFTPSHVVNGKERSERGLLNMDNEGFGFVRVNADDYPDDIVNEASPEKRMGLVPEGTAPVGYIPYGTPLYTDAGEIIWGNILPSPPTDGTPYAPFYGEKFLVHEEFFTKETPLTIDVFKKLFECVQRIRYKGPTLKGFFEVTQLLCEDYVYDLEIVPSGRYYTVYYRLDEASQIHNRERKFTAWGTICRQKFKLFAVMPQP